MEFEIRRQRRRGNRNLEHLELSAFAIYQIEALISLNECAGLCVSGFFPEVISMLEYLYKKRGFYVWYDLKIDQDAYLKYIMISTRDPNARGCTLL